MGEGKWPLFFWLFFIVSLEVLVMWGGEGDWIGIGVMRSEGQCVTCLSSRSCF